MSQENVALARALISAFVRVARADSTQWQRFVEDFCHPEIEWVNPENAIDPGIRRGHEGMAQVRAALFGAFEWIRFEPEEIIDAGDDQVVVAGVMRIKGGESGAEVGQDLEALVRFREGKCIRYQWFTEQLPGAALKAAGVGG